ncbi:N-acetylmuramoyl-L-alanine amidase [Streptomyces sp. TRM 70351]|uniref:N-acetylmuramoyl-L-alanine amidase n=1 Tax=Streptomyces sp. TRM 70351 TaxID=3116552 RepID=UPI002E7AEF4E|nr:N-acetylmuramoyl-L-alanine amidase [Streptomyces sp. TRM 70351]MEE1929324.1 N-acetylmuramoyl-L-alanine amidase [Streptomyces sp. TRM 70351]
MRALLSSSIGVACTAALLVPLAPSATATVTARPAQPQAPVAASAAAPAAGPRTGAAADRGPDGAGRPASHRSVPLPRLDPGAGSDRAGGSAGLAGADAGFAPRTVERFSLAGVSWDDAAEHLHGRVQVRTRDADTGTWSPWQPLETHSHDAPDPGSPERREGTVRGSTAPLWAGAADGVAVRVLPESGEQTARLPRGLRLELVDPGSGPGDPAGGTAEAPEDRDGGYLPPETGAETGVETAAHPAGGPAARFAATGSAPADGTRAAAPAPSGLTPQDAASSAANAQLAELGATLIPALDRAEAEADLVAAHDGAAPATRDAGGAQARPFIGPRPGIVTRRGWGADERLREGGFLYTNTVKAAFVHHTAGTNNYTCAQVPSILRGIYQYHVGSLGWRDVGYNFFVDKCGKIYEGRAGGVARPVMGAHTYGFNSDTTGIAVLGTFTSAEPARAATDAVAKITAWKLGLYGANPAASTSLVSGGGKYKKGTRVTMRTIAGHRDGFNTACPGARLYGKLPSIRSLAARLQGR